MRMRVVEFANFRTPSINCFSLTKNKENCHTKMFENRKSEWLKVLEEFLWGEKLHPTWVLNASFSPYRYANEAVQIGSALAVEDCYHRIVPVADLIVSLSSPVRFPFRGLKAFPQLLPLLSARLSCTLITPHSCVCFGIIVSLLSLYHWIHVSHFVWRFHRHYKL